MSTAAKPPEWYELALVSAGVSAIISLLGGWLIAWWTGAKYKLRKYEDQLVAERVSKCNELIQLVLDLCQHISPVAKGTNALEKRGTFSRPGEPGTEETQKTIELRRRLYDFVQRNALFLGRDLCQTIIYFDVGFDELSYRVGLPDGPHTAYFPAICHWTWALEDQLNTKLAFALRDATFNPPTALEIQAARTKGHQDMGALIKRIEANPQAYTIEARNARMRDLAGKIKIEVK